MSRDGILVVVIALGLGLAALWSVRSCSTQLRPTTGLPAGTRYVMRCNNCWHEFSMTPAELRAAYDRGDLRGSGDGHDLFRCPQCGQYRAQQVLRGTDALP